ncbi:MAG TPA: Ku protein [Balneolaceae bacterium]
MRTIWKGHIQFSLVTIPIRLYSAVDSAKSISFDLLTRNDHHPVGYQKIDKNTGKPVSKEDIVKGYEYEPDQYVIIEKEDIEKVQPKMSKAIEIRGFVDKNEAHPALYDKPYFIGPDSETTAKTYSLFRQTLEKSGKVGVGTVVLRNKESPALLTVHEGGILMYKLRYPNQMRSMKDVPNLANGQADEEQLKMAQTLVDSMSRKFTEIDLENDYYNAMKEMIEAKVEGKEVISVTEEEAKPRDIMTALKESIESSKKPMEKAKGEAKKEKKASKGKTG